MEEPITGIPHVELNLLDLMMKNKIRTIQELHEKSGISRTTISGHIHGNKRAIRIITIEKLCSAFNCDVGDLIVLKKSPRTAI